MNNFNKGDKVQLKKGSEYYLDQGFDSNGVIRTFVINDIWNSSITNCIVHCRSITDNYKNQYKLTDLVRMKKIKKYKRKQLKF
jgi:hypothetical protein